MATADHTFSQSMLPAVTHNISSCSDTQSFYRRRRRRSRRRLQAAAMIARRRVVCVRAAAGGHRVVSTATVSRRRRAMQDSASQKLATFNGLRRVYHSLRLSLSSQDDHWLGAMNRDVTSARNNDECKVRDRSLKMSLDSLNSVVRAIKVACLSSYSDCGKTPVLFKIW